MIVRRTGGGDATLAAANDADRGEDNKLAEFDIEFDALGDDIDGGTVVGEWRGSTGDAKAAVSDEIVEREEEGVERLDEDAEEGRGEEKDEEEMLGLEDEEGNGELGSVIIL